MPKKWLFVFLALFFSSPVSAQDSGNVQKLTTGDLDELTRKLEPTMKDPRFKDVEIQVKPGGASTKACVKVDGVVCCGGRDACGQRQ
jgi:hypothetical protein